MAQRWPSCCRLAWAKATQDCAHAKIHIHIYAFVNIASAYAFEMRFCASALLCSQGMRPVRFQLHKQTNTHKYIYIYICMHGMHYVRLGSRTFGCLSGKPFIMPQNTLTRFAVAHGFTFVAALIFPVRLGLSNCPMHIKELAGF